MPKSHPMLMGFILLTAAALGRAQGGTNHSPMGAVTDLAGGGHGEDEAATAVANPASADPVEVHSSEADDRLARAEKHFTAGRQFYFQDNLTAARREFDAAIEALLNAPESLPDHRRLERRLEEMSDLIYRFDIEKLGAGQSEEAVVFDKAPIDEISHMTFAVDPNLAPKLKEELNQTTSAIPLELSDPVLGFVHYFSTDRGRQILSAGLRRSGRYKALIERILTEEGLPQELIYVAQAESGFLPRAVSNKKAVGMWQFVAGTGAQYELVRTSTSDDRFDPEKATRAAAKHLKDLYARYGDWYLAIAAYDCGAGAVDRAVERTGYADYWELLKRHALPKETASYVPIIIAMTIMAKNPKDYSLEDIQLDPPVEYDSLQLTAPTNLNLVADATMQPLSEIQELNPSLLRLLAPSGFQIHVPKGSAEAAQAALESVPPANRQAWRLHRVEAGDTLETIAKAYHLPAERIVAVNRATDSLEAGDMLLIPALYHEEPRPRYTRARRTRGKIALSTALRSNKPATGHSSHHVPSQVLHRKAGIRTAALENQ